MRLSLIANRGSGGGLEPEALAEAMRRRGAEVTVHPVEDREQAGAEDVDRLVVAGGDGSIGPAADLAGRLGVPLAVVAAGTANDFSRAHGLPLDREAAIDLAVRGTATRGLELGRLDGRPFVNVVSAGLAPVAARHARIHKKLLGPLAYVIGAVQAGLTAHPVECTVVADGRTIYEGESWQVIVSVSGAFGGGARIDDADPVDGKLHVTVVPVGSRLGLARRAAGMRRGDLTDQPGIVEAEGTVMDLGLEDGAEVNLDGEVCGPGHLTVQPAAFSLVVG